MWRAPLLRRVCAKQGACVFEALALRQQFKTHVMALASSTSGKEEANDTGCLLFTKKKKLDKKTPPRRKKMEVVQPHREESNEEENHQGKDSATSLGI